MRSSVFNTNTLSCSLGRGYIKRNINCDSNCDKVNSVMSFMSRYIGKAVRHICKAKIIKLSTERLHKGIKSPRIESHCSIEKTADFLE